MTAEARRELARKTNEKLPAKNRASEPRLEGGSKGGKYSSGVGSEGNKIAGRIGSHDGTKARTVENKAARAERGKPDKRSAPAQRQARDTMAEVRRRRDCSLRQRTSCGNASCLQPALPVEAFFLARVQDDLRRYLFEVLRQVILSLLVLLRQPDYGQQCPPCMGGPVPSWIPGLPLEVSSLNHAVLLAAYARSLKPPMTF